LWLRVATHRCRIAAVRRAFAILLLTLIAVLPAIDAIACPDGCSDPAHSSTTLEAASTCAATACGLCLNSCFVHCDHARILPTQRYVTAMPQLFADMTFVPRRAPERPPRAV